MGDRNDMDEVGPHGCILTIWMKFDMVWMKFDFMDENNMMDEISIDNFNGYVDQFNHIKMMIKLVYECSFI